MNKITKLDTVQHYCDLFGIAALHPIIVKFICTVFSIQMYKKMFF